MRTPSTHPSRSWPISANGFLEDYAAVRCKPRTLTEYRRAVSLYIDPAIGGMRISEVQRKDIAALHHDLRDTPYQANRTLAVLSKMFSLAEVWGWRANGSNPCRHVQRYKEHPRERFLSQEETERLGKVLHEAEPEMPPAVAAFRLLAAHGLPAVGNPDAALGRRQGRLHRTAGCQDRRPRGAARTGSARRASKAAARRRQSLGHRWQAAGHAFHRPPAAVAAHPRGAPDWKTCEFTIFDIRMRAGRWRSGRA